MNELYHHGVKGQKWGVKNGPPYPLNSGTSKMVIKKGTTLQRISSVENERETKTHMYASFKEIDNDRYVVEWAAPGFVANIEVTNDLIAPSYKERNNAALTAMRAAGDFDKVVYDVSRSKRNKNVDRLINQVKDESVSQLTYKQYKDFASSLTYSKYNRTLFFKELEKRGYNCVIDDNDRGWTDKPIIVFNRQANTKVKSVRPLKLNEVLEKADKLGYSKEDKDLLTELFNK